MHRPTDYDKGHKEEAHYSTHTKTQKCISHFVRPTSFSSFRRIIYTYLSIYLGIIQILVSFGIVYYAATHGYRYVYDHRRFFFVHLLFYKIITRT